MKKTRSYLARYWSTDGKTLNAYIGTVADLEDNWRRLLDAAELTPAERQEAEGAYQRALRLTPTWWS